ncbi:MAG TPA: RodZ domain-containing protein [Humidesulfovibrio sp.]|uniref:RodZ domain-containing protein n=1 Tax=Humidesulfovibrio sp. TaxID=2910988 RepID=UPI002C8429A4|nr:RodZ domain-containing protein [Humidesulfovibrio sp.]HWR04810.1 RodZ domain-containing protein [Humidesulfovibrio sp.]
MNLMELGGLLKQERERRGLSVRDVMDATKISRRNLNALEDGAVKLLPHPVYLKGYVRNYARLVGLAPEPLVAVVDEQSDGDSGYVPQVPTPAAPAVPDAQVAEPTPSEPSLTETEPAVTPAETLSSGPAPDVAPLAESVAAPLAAPAAEAVSEPDSWPAAAPVAAPVQEKAEEPESQIRFPKPADLTPKPRRRAWLWVVLLILAAGCAGLVYQFQRIQAETEPAAPVAALLPAENATNATDVTDTNSTESGATLPEANASEAAPAPSQAPAVSPAASGSTPSAMPEFKTGAPMASAPLTGASVASAPIEVSRKAPQPAAAPEARTQGMQELVVIGKPGESCWVEVSEGQRRKTFTLRDGDSRRFEFSQKAKIRLGNAGGVSFQLNGAFYPYEGQRGQTATLEIGN